MGVDRQYTVSSDSEGKSLKGERYYKMHLPKGIPSCNFWSVIVYDSQTRLIIHTDQSWPSVYSTQKGLIVNNDGSVDIYSGPAEQKGEVSNFIKTIPGKKWYLILRLYDLPDRDIDIIWKPDEIREVVTDSE